MMVNLMTVSDSENMANIPDAGVARLDYFVRRRTSTLRISNYELARRGGPNRTTLHKAVNGTGRLRESTLARIDGTLGWAPGSSAQILAGGDPQTLMVSGPDDEHVVTVLRAATAMVDNAVELLGTAKILMCDLIGDSKPTGTEA
jgi:hypothetical protein